MPRTKVEMYRNRIPLTHHNTHGPRVDDELLWDAIVDVEDGFGVVEQLRVSWTCPPLRPVIRLPPPLSVDVVCGPWLYPRSLISIHPGGAGCR